MPWGGRGGLHRRHGPPRRTCPCRLGTDRRSSRRDRDSSLRLEQKRHNRPTAVPFTLLAALPHRAGSLRYSSLRMRQSHPHHLQTASRNGSMPDLPSGTVTFLFTDIEGSTRLWERDAPAMREAVARHLAI